MGKSGQLYMEMMEAMDPADRLRMEMAQNDYSPHDYATSQAEWHDTLGACIEMCWRVLQEQKGTDTPAFNLFHSAEHFAVEVVAQKRPLNIDEAYIAMGYPQPEQPDGQMELPF